MNLDLFTPHLRRAIQWTERLAAGFDFEHGDYGGVFRQTNPLIDGQRLYRLDRGGLDYGDTYTTWNADDYRLRSYMQALGAVLGQRAAGVPDTDEPRPAELAALGRILLFETQWTTHDGIAIVESRCFVDESDVPPLDTWFHLQQQVPDFHNPVLYCWIPRAFEPIMQAAIDVEMMRSYHWLDEAAPQLYGRILARL